MKSPDEIKKGLSCHMTCNRSCEGCAYNDMPEITNRPCTDSLCTDALAYIQQLEAERDALIEEMKNAHSCFACKKFHRNGGDCCGGSVCMMRDFEWRGVQKEE